MALHNYDIDYEDEPLPQYDVTSLVSLFTRMPAPNARSTTISVEVISVGSPTNNVVPDHHIFHDDEVLAIIHRSKGNDSLVATSVWGWKGKNATDWDNKEPRLLELAKRYGTTLVSTHRRSPSVLLKYL